MYVIHEPERFRRGHYRRGVDGACCLIGEILYQMGLNPCRLTKLPAQVVADRFGCEPESILRFEWRFEGFGDRQQEDGHALLRELCARFPDKLLLIPRESSQTPSAAIPHGVNPPEPEAPEEYPAHGPVGSTETVGV